MITIQDWITSSGRYPERAKSPDLTPEVLKNAEDLIARVNALLKEIGWTKPVSISSGFRPAAVNSKIQNAAKRSAHMTGKALDIFQDKKDAQELGRLIRKIQDNQGVKGILGRHGLMMESLEATIGKNSDWVHIDTVFRKERPSMEFKP